MKKDTLFPSIPTEVKMTRIKEKIRRVLETDCANKITVMDEKALVGLVTDTL